MTTINDILPFEILSEVFYHLTANHGALALHGVLLVCRLWYNVALKEPRLWVMISIDKIFLSRLFPMPSRAARRFAQQCVDRSGRLPIHIFISIISPHTAGNRKRIIRSPGSTGPLCAKIDAMMGIDHFNRNSSRLETLIIHGITPDDCIMGTLMLNRWKLPLRRLELHRSAARCKTHSIPLVTSIAFINPIWAFRSAEIAKQHDTDTKLLSLQKSWAWFLEDLLILGAYQALTSLRLISKPSIGDVKSTFYPFHLEQDNPSVSLPSVNTLSLTGEIPHKMLGALSLPALVAIEIRNYGTRHSMGHLQNTTLHHNIAKLEVLMAGWEAHWWTSDLAAVLTATLNLRTFVVSPPMLSHLPQTSVLDRANLVVRQG